MIKKNKGGHIDTTAITHHHISIIFTKPLTVIFTNFRATLRHLNIGDRKRGTKEKDKQLKLGKPQMRPPHLQYTDANKNTKPQMKDLKEESIHFCHYASPLVSKIIALDKRRGKQTTRTKPSNTKFKIQINE